MVRSLGKSPLGNSPLGLDEDLLVQCVSCGLCLPHCPTYRSTEEESASPRGRITMMRAVESGALQIDDDFVNFMERCVQCRGCETACPSGVQFGRLMEATREALATRGDTAPWWLRRGLNLLGYHRLVLVGSTMLGIAQRMRLVPQSLQAKLSLPARMPIRRKKLVSDPSPDAWLFTGCVMDAWQRDVHAAALRVMRATGSTVAVPAAGSGADCCGALHSHAGLTDAARQFAERVIGAFPGTAPIVVDSAGCGAALKDYGHLVGTDSAEAFSSRVLDVGEWLAERVDQLPAGRHLGAVVVQDPCHLRHVQRAHLATRVALGRYADLMEIDDDGRCCGAGGAYSVLQPELAESIRADKVAAIGRTGVTMVASANPGCSMWLSGAGLSVEHPVTLIDRAISDQGKESNARGRL
jgi:glycolate oxidase iron-sulfur subunit